MSELAPVTLEGWYALHQLFAIDAAAAIAAGSRRRDIAAEAAALLARLAAPPAGGWSAAFQLVGGGADLLIIHFRPTFDDVGHAGRELLQSGLAPLLRPHYAFASITEAALYHATLDAAREAAPASAAYQQRLEELSAAERDGPRMAQRLYPQPPAEMRYVSFYPMSKRRTHPDNWYLLPLEQRSRLMHDHGLTGRRFAGRLLQIITGATGLDDWEFGVTLFARDPLEFKRIVTEMRYDEASARYAEFGPFFTGFRIDDDGWTTLLGAG